MLLVENEVIDEETAKPKRAAPFLNFNDRISLAIAVATSHCIWRLRLEARAVTY
jgi:hypothetical protein